MKRMADLKKFTTTLTQLHFSSQKNRSFPGRKSKEKLQCSSLDGEGTLTGTAKLVLDINIQKNDAR